MRVIVSLLAFCTVSVSAYADVFRVGNTSQDRCDYETIQEAVLAATANGPGVDTIEVANGGNYSNTAVDIGDKSLIIQGGFDSCQFGQPDVAADVSGDGVHPVIRIAPSTSAGTTVTLIGLNIHGGGTAGVSGTNGGGVYVTNNVFLRIANTTISQNNAANGGGIFIDGATGYPAVQLDPGVTIQNNHVALNGGGVYLSNGNLLLVADQVHIDSNVAGGAGGGVALFAGTMSVGNPDQLAARFDVTGATVSGNQSGTYGGGIYAVGSGTSMFANELIVDSNTAALAGGGIMASNSAGVVMMRDYPSAFAFQCPNWRQCSRVSGNSVGNSSSGLVGGAIALYSGAHAQIAQTIIRGNTAQTGSVAYLDDANTLVMEGVLATANQSYNDTIAGVPIRTHHSTAAPHVRIAYSTFSGNLQQFVMGPNLPAEDIIADQGTSLAIYSTAFFDSAYPIVAYTAYTDDCVVRDSGSIDDPLGTHTRILHTNTPGFNNPSAYDFRLRSESTLNDYCDASVYAASFRDIVLTPRCHDDGRKANTYGACDVGAYESDHIFGNGFD